MINENDLKTIREISKKFNAEKVVLFGSSLNDYLKSNDIDLAVMGVSPKDYYSYCGEIMFGLSKPVDIVDLSVNCKFNDIILREGQVIYG